MSQVVRVTGAEELELLTLLLLLLADLL